MKYSVFFSAFLIAVLLVTLVFAAFTGGSVLQKLAAGQISAFEASGQRFLTDMQTFNDAASWWHDRFKTMLAASASDNPDRDSISELCRETETWGENRLKIVVWKNDGNILFASPGFDTRRFAWTAIFRALEAAQNSADGVVPAEADADLSALYELFGEPVLPQFLNIPQEHENQFISVRPAPDVPIFWLQRQKNTAMWVQLPRAMVEEPVHLKAAVMQQAAILAPDQAVFLLKAAPDSDLEIVANSGLPGLSDQIKLSSILSAIGKQPRSRWHFACKNVVGHYYLAFARWKPLWVAVCSLEHLQFILLMVMLLLVTPFLVVIGKGWNSFRVTTKLCLLFILANVMPMSLVLTGFGDYLWQKATVTQAYRQEKVAEALRSLDENYLSFKSDIEWGLGLLVQDLQALLQTSAESESVCIWLKKHLEQFPYTNFTLVAMDSKILCTERGILGPSHKQKPGSKEEMITSLMHYVLYKSGKSVKPDMKLEMLDSFVAAVNNMPAEEVVLDFIRQDRRFRDFGFGKTILPTYIAFVKGQDSVDFRYALIVSFRNQILQQKYLAEALPGMQRNAAGIRFVAIDEQNNIIGSFADPKNGPEFVQRFKSFWAGLEVLPQKYPGVIKTGDELCEMFGIRGQNLNIFRLAALQPVQEYATLLATDKLHLALFVGLNLVFLMLLVMLLSRRFIGPLKDLAAGVRALATRNFAHRVPVQLNNELGLAATAFNTIMDDSYDLQLARQVQQRLFPVGHFYHEKLSVLGNSSSMGELGGDYYDCFLVSDHQVAFLIGDVTGHGVPAALIMAMAKTATVQNRQLWTRPKELLEEIHYLLRTIWKPDSPRNMSFQYFLVDSATGETIIANAGHPFPVVIRQNGSIETIKFISVPLASIPRPMVDVRSIKLLAGDKLVAWTDGLAEMTAESGEVLGYEKVPGLFSASYNHDSEVMLADILLRVAAFRKGSPVNDDLTILLASFND